LIGFLLKFFYIASWAQNRMIALTDGPQIWTICAFVYITPQHDL